MCETGGKLTEQKLLEALLAFGVPEVKLSDLVKPTGEFVRHVFVHCLTDFQIDLNKLRPFRTLQLMEDPDMFYETQIDILIIKTINWMLEHQNEVITMSDLVAPRPKRTKKILNLLVIGWRNYLMSMNHFKQIEEDYEQVVKEVNSLKTDIDRLQRELEESADKLSEIKPPIDELKTLVDERQAQVADMEIKHKEVTDLYNEMKRKESEINNKAVSVDIEVASAKEELHELQKHILKSPEQLDRDLLDLKEKIRREEAIAIEKEAERKTKMKSNEVLAQNIEIMKKEIEELEKNSSALVAFRESVGEALEVLSQNEKGMKELGELEADIATKLKMQEFLFEKAKRSELLCRKQKASLKETLQQCQMSKSEEGKRLCNVQSKCEDVRRSFDVVVSSLERIVAQGNEAQKRTQQRVLLTQKTLKEMRDTFLADCSEVEKAVKNFFDNRKS